MSETVLKVAGVSKRFGGLQALSDVGITITKGQVNRVTASVTVLGRFISY